MACKQKFQVVAVVQDSATIIEAVSALAKQNGAEIVSVVHKQADKRILEEHVEIVFKVSSQENGKEIVDRLLQEDGLLLAGSSCVCTECNEALRVSAAIVEASIRPESKVVH